MSTFFPQNDRFEKKNAPFEEKNAHFEEKNPHFREKTDSFSGFFAVYKSLLTQQFSKMIRDQNRQYLSCISHIIEVLVSTSLPRIIISNIQTFLD